MQKVEILLAVLVATLPLAAGIAWLVGAAKGRW